MTRDEVGDAGFERNRRRLSWIDILSFAGFLAALYVIYRLLARSEWPGISADDAVLVIIALCVGTASLVVGGGVLLSVIRSTERSAAFSFLLCATVANRAILSKYIPGKIWYIVGIGESLVQAGMGRTRSWMIVLLYQIILIGAALIVGLGSLSRFGLNNSTFRGLAGDEHFWVAVSIVVAIATITLIVGRGLFAGVVAAGRAVATKLVRPKWLAVGILIGVVHWLMQGLSIWMFLSGIHGEWLDATTILVVPAIYAIGFLVLIAPGGMGVRELLFVQYFLFTGMSIESASAMAILARVAAIVSEVSVWVIVHVNLQRLGRSRSR